MNVLVTVVRELIRLFIDDGSLALAILSVVSFAAVLAAAVPECPLATGAALLFGCLGVLVANVAQATRR